MSTIIVFFCCIGKTFVGTDYSALTEEIESIHNAPNFEVGGRVSITKYKNILSKGCFENW